MAGKSPVMASDEQRTGLLALGDSRDRGEDRARAVLLKTSMPQKVPTTAPLAVGCMS
jgi:hypothetical protein